MKVVVHRENPFPDDLEGRLNAMLNVVNTELKTLTLLHLDDTPASGNEIKARIRETVGRGCYLPLKRCFGNYCNRTLLPIGTVAEEEVIRDTGNRVYIGYKLTEAGKKYGLPISTFNLDYAAQSGKSMYSILGSSNTSGKSRSPLNRVKLLEALRKKPIKIADLVRIINLDEKSVVKSLKSLEKIGFVQYDTVGEIRKGRKDLAPYLWIELKRPIEAQKVVTFKIASIKVAQLMSKHKKSDCNKMAKLSGYSPNSICSIFSGLEKQGLIRRERWKGGEILSEVSLLDEGRKFLDLYIDALRDALSNGQTLRNMQESYEIYMRDLNRFRDCSRKLISVYRQVSPSINGIPVEATNERIFNYLENNPGKRPIEIEKKLSIKCPHKYLTPLFKNGVLRKEKLGRETRYYIDK